MRKRVMALALHANPVGSDAPRSFRPPWNNQPAEHRHHSLARRASHVVPEAPPASRRSTRS